jgi:hypothetical protein
LGLKQGVCPVYFLKEKKMIIEEAADFLMSYFKEDREQIDILIKTDYALSFLLIWSIFESKCFDAFLTINDLDNEDIKNDKEFNEFSNDAAYFHNLYQSNKTRWKNLKYKEENYKDLDNLLKGNYEDLLKGDKIKFGLFVIYRYRNNIFHGNKKILSWINYKEEIKRCIKMMIAYMRGNNIQEVGK